MRTKAVIRVLVGVLAVPMLTGCGERADRIEALPETAGLPLAEATRAITGAGGSLAIERVDGVPLTTGGDSIADPGFRVVRGLTVCSMRRNTGIDEEHDVVLRVARRCP